VRRREQGDMALYSSDEDKKLTIIVSMVVIELKKECAWCLDKKPLMKNKKIKYIIQLVSS